ncbi:peptidoglycan D,D-transpeptidase FtsI family protein [Streptomyces xinghaiensis]|uniref:Penicillin-binding protein 2 n=3 Tax=Streptomyces TaxID=1883 RepID=A0A420VA24_9ACTN|nr:penicillin-binding protein 2 [Streptomyces xinghaiensis]PQM25136.1 penicillin-binding protein 2 [Streptomyces xinghaiensis]RKM99187.1 penicillin-binding protein 2 [Streptomyces xinghaiensis]RNC75908.1 penicillin-binding protein 2 [Streptomyces xinghaiensis]
MSDPQQPRRRVPGPAAPRGRRPGPAGRTPRSGGAKGRGPGAPSGRGPRPGRPAQRPIRLGSPRPRLRLISLTLTLVMLAFVVRLLQVQAVEADTYAAKSRVNRYITHTIAAERGSITDRSGGELATTVDAYDIIGDPYLFTPEQSGSRDAPERAAELLAPILERDEDGLAEKLSAGDSRYAVLARRQSPQVWQQIKDLRDGFAEKAGSGGESNPLAGIYQEPHSKRIYPNRELAAGILGFVNAEGRGGGGLEAKLDKELAGEPGKITYAHSGGRRVPTESAREQPAVPGSDVRLTIDRDLQWAAQRAITEQVRTSGAQRGYVVVQDTRTGEILALANAPGFDPNDISAAGTGLGNPALQDAYEPGSTSKVMSMAAVLEEGAATPGTHVTVPNRLHRADRLFADDVDHPTWYLTLNGVLAKSSNLGTILAVEQLGTTQKEANKVLHSYLRKFGIGRPTGLGYPGETPGILAKPEDWSASQQYTIPFGQGLSINAVQAASVYSTIANGGVRVEPTLVRGTTGPDGRFTPAPEPRATRVISEKTAKTLARMLESVVGSEEGTGTKARIPGYRVAGKTGTSNRVDPDTGRYNGYTASFAGFAPADRPRVTVYCAVQDPDPDKGSYFGGQVCGPVYKQVTEFALKSLKVAPTGADPAKLPVTFEPRG